MTISTTFRQHALSVSTRGAVSSCGYSTSTIPRKVIFSGIQPTGVPHLGNYLGALRQWKKLQGESSPETKLIYSLVDLHALTVQQDPAQLRRWKDESLAMLLAIGLDSQRCILFHQSDVTAHAELMWILSCQASMGYLGRMTQWKDKTSKSDDKSQKLGLFSYPVLQAADVLVHGTTHVPVGHDQAQHLEFAREVAIGFNHVYGGGSTLLIPPETIISPAARVKSLARPESKMSKSDPVAKGKVLLTDAKEVVESKIKSAVTDSISGITYDPHSRPGISNLIDLLFHTKYKGVGVTQEDLAKDMANCKPVTLKVAVAEAVNAVVQPIRERYLEIIDDEALLHDVARDGARRAAENAASTMSRVRKSVGLS